MSDPQKLQKLIDQLLATGLAHSQMHAREMAQEMIGTGNKVNREYEDKKEDLTTGMKREPRISPARTEVGNKAYNDNIARMRASALSAAPVEIKTDYETPDPGFKNVDDLVPAEEAKDEPVQEVEEILEEIEEDPIVEEEPVYVAEPEEPSYDSDEDSSSEEEAEPAVFQEAIEEAPAEASIDLSNVFNFGK